MTFERGSERDETGELFEAKRTRATQKENRANLSTNERLQRQRCKHVESEAQSSDVDQDIVLREIVEDVGLNETRQQRSALEGRESFDEREETNLGLVREDEKPRESHSNARYE